MLKKSAILVMVGTFATSAYAQPYPVWITEPSVQMTRAKGYIRNMQALGFSGNIESCNQMVRVGSSYGAICKLKVKGKARSAMICNDDMIGHFAMKTTFAHGELVRFIEANCLGG